MRVHFPGVTAVATRNMYCERGCGRKTTRQKTFISTINPFNKNSDGTVKTESQVRAQVQEKADAWRPEPYTCKNCKETSNG